MSSKRSPMLPDRRGTTWRGRLGGLLALVLAVGSVGLPASVDPVAAEPANAEPATADDAAFGRAVREVGGQCTRNAATICAARAFDMIDADNDGLADLEELRAVDAHLRVWANDNADALDPMDLRALRVGFLLIDTIGIERGMMLYDDDGDGALSQAEMTADLVLDGRPLPELVRSRELVDWPSLRRRFGATAMIFDYLDIR